MRTWFARLTSLAAIFGALPVAPSQATPQAPISARPAAGQSDTSDNGPDEASAGNALGQAAQASAAKLESVRRSTGENSQPYAFALRAHARNLIALGKFSEAEPLVRQAVTTLTALRGESDVQTASARSQLGLVILRVGRSDEAEPLLRSACQALVAASGPQDTQALNCQIYLGMSLIALGRDHDARTILRQVVQIREKTAPATDTILLSAKAQLGRTLRDEGNLGPAEVMLRNVADSRRRTLGPSNNLTLTAMTELAVVLVAEQRPAEAEPLYRACLAAREAALGERHPDTLIVMDELARDLALQGKTLEAEQLIRKALSVQTEVLGESQINTLASMNTLAFVLRREGKFDAAEAVMRRSLELRTRALGPDNPSTLGTMVALAGDLAVQSHYGQAEQLLDQAIALQRQQRSQGHSGLDSALVQLGYVRLSQPDRAGQALAPLREVVANLRRRRANASFSPVVDVELSRATISQAGTYRLQADADWAGAQALPGQADAMREEAFLALQDAMAGTVTQSFALAAARTAARSAGSSIGDLAEQRQQLADQWRALADRKTEALMGQATDGQGEAPRPGQLMAIERQIGDIDQQLRAKAPSYFALTRPEPVPLDEARQLLAPDEALLIVVPSAFGTHVMALNRGGLAWHRSNLTRGAVAAIVGTLRSQLNPEAIARNNRPFNRQLAHRLYLELISPLEPALAGKKRVLVAADGALASLPFEVLVVGQPSGSDDDPASLRTTAWFGEAHALSQLPSLQTLKFLRAMQLNAPDAGTSFEGFGDPKLGGGATKRGEASPGKATVASVSELVSLPGTGDELRRIASALAAPADTVHLGDGATKTAVKAMNLAHTRIVAFATHGLLPGELQGIDEPGLVFTPNSAPGAQDNGFLSASEITQLKLDANLVILSACNSGSGDGENTPPLSGLARSFFYAGAKTLLVSHWPVYDDVAPRITVEVIAEHRADPKLSLAEALQRATRKIRNDPSDPSLAFPSAWAPFVVVGE